MIINTSKGKFIIQFQHTAPCIFGPTNPTTECRVLLFEEGKKTEECVILAEGKATCHSADQFTRAKGRKIALSKALKNPNETVIADRSIPLHDKDFRVEIWHGYFAALNRPINEEVVEKNKRKQKQEKNKHNKKPKTNLNEDMFEGLEFLKTMRDNMQVMAKAKAKLEFHTMYAELTIAQMVENDLPPKIAINRINQIVDTMFALSE